MASYPKIQRMSTAYGRTRRKRGHTDAFRITSTPSSTPPLCIFTSSPAPNPAGCTSRGKPLSRIPPFPSTGIAFQHSLFPPVSLCPVLFWRQDMLCGAGAGSSSFLFWVHICHGSRQWELALWCAGWCIRGWLGGLDTLVDQYVWCTFTE